MVKLGAGESKKVQKERMWRERETSVHMQEKQKSFTLLRKRFFFPTRWNATTMARDHSKVLISLEHLVCDDRRQPFPGRHDANGTPRPKQQRRGKFARGRQRGKMEDLGRFESKHEGGRGIAARVR